jgi:hypothetical protein
MAEERAERLKIAEQIRQELAVQNQLTPHQARAFVRGLQISWQVPTIQWRDNESLEQFEDARRLLHAAEIFRELEGIDSLRAKDCYRRAAELLEWLSRAGDPLRFITPIELLAAASFQLGGLPAMALGLLSQIETPDDGTRLYSKFLRADFDGVAEAVLIFWTEHYNLTRRDASILLLSGNEPGCLEWYFTVELVRCLGLISVTLRQGDEERLEQGLLKLRALEKVATRTFSDDISLLISLLTAVAEGYKAASIYGPISQLAIARPDKTSRLKKFARDQFARGRGILWASQQHGLKRLLDASSFALCTPTGSGKTLVANFALIKELLLAPDDVSGAMALYLVPSRALAGEVEAKLTNELGRDLIVTGLYGGADWGITDYWLKTNRPTVLIATVEKADALMRYVGPLLIARLRLLIIDEAHQVVTEDSERAFLDFAEHSSRSLRLEGFVSRLLARAPTVSCIALTAVSAGAAAPIAHWVEGQSDAVPIGTTYRSTRQIIGTLNALPGRVSEISVDMMNGSMLYVRGRDAPVFIPLRMPPMPQLPADMRNSVYRYNELNVLWTALHLAQGDRRILISVAQQPEQTMRWFKEALDLPSWADAYRFGPIADPTDLIRFEEARAACIDYCGEDSYELALLDWGIATSHGQMPQRLRRLMTDLIDRRICPITVATATLTEGVNLPFDLIFVLSLRRTSFNASTRQSEVTPLSTSEFRNLAGRAGRPGASRAMEGMTLAALPVQPSTTAPSMLRRQRGQIKEMRSDYDALLESLRVEGGRNVVSPLALLLGTIAERADTLFGLRDESFMQWLEETAPGDIDSNAGIALNTEPARLADSIDELDGVLLTALEEMNSANLAQLSEADTEVLLIRLWRRTFSSVAAVQEGWLEQAFVRRGKGLINTIYPDLEERKRLFQYGFSPHVGRRFEQIAPSIRAVLERANGYGEYDAEQRLVFFEEIGELLVGDRGFGFRVRDTATDAGLLQHWRQLLAWWVQMPNATSPHPAQLRSWQRFVSDNIEFRLGVAIGSVVAQAWSAGTDDPLAVPSLEEWRQATDLPWFGFWARELLRWGTLDPFVAFALAQGLAGTRSDAADRRSEFEAWIEANYVEIEADDWIDPRYFLEWQNSLSTQMDAPNEVRRIGVELTGTDGRRGRYSVLPIERDGRVHWIDPSGFELAASTVTDITSRPHRNDYELQHFRSGWGIRRAFRAS